MGGWTRVRVRLIVAAMTMGGAGLVVLAAPAAAMPAPPVGRQAPDFVARGMDGRTHRLSDYRGSTVVLEWMSPVCEFTAQQYDTGNMQRLQGFAAQHKIVWLSIDTAGPAKPGYLSPADAAALTRKHGAKITSFLFDTSGAIGRSYGATSTPTIYVVDRSGRLVYAGPVSAAWGDPRTAKNYAREALGQVIAHKPVTAPLIRQYGCPIKY